MSEIAEKTAEVVAENVDDVVEMIDAVRAGTNFKIVGGALFVGGLMIGAAGGYLFAVKKLGKEFDQRLTEEIEDAKAFYASFNKVDRDGAILTPQEVMDQRHGAGAAAEALREYQGQEPDEDGLVEVEPGILIDPQDENQIRKIEEARLHSVSVDKEVGPGGGKITKVTHSEVQNVFVDPKFDLEEELKYRTADKPYIITHDEFYEAEREYETVSLTYYELDDTLVNESDQPIENTDEMIGDDHLVRFGAGSKDPKIVYVRNEKLESDFEIIKSTGSYLEEVLGMLPEEPNSLKHSDQRDRRRAFRHGEG